MAKKLTVLTLLGFVAFCASVISGAAINFDGYFVNANQDPESVYTEVLDKADAPTDSTTYVDSIIAGGTHSQYTYTKVKAAEDKLCTLDAGGAITKVEEALGLECVNVTFEGSLNVETRFEEAGEVTTYSVTSGVQLTLCGNYISLVALSETTIEEITLVYACSHSFETEHNLLETEETVLNGTDEDRVWKCQYCDYTEVRVDPNGFNTYRNGEFVVVQKTNSTLTLTEQTVDIGGVGNTIKIEGGNDYNNWDNKVEPSLVTEAGRAYAYNISDYDINYITFDIYLKTGAQLRLYGPSATQVANKGFGLSIGSTITYGNNSDILIYKDNVPVTKVEAEQWYTVSFNYSYINRETWPYTTTFACSEIATPKGDIYLSNLRYWHTAPIDTMDEEFVWGHVYNGTTLLDHVGTFGPHSNDVGGRTSSYAFTGTGTYKDQIDANFSVSNGSPANAGNGANAWYYVWSYVRQQHISSISFDIYVPTGASLRLQSRPSTAQITHLVEAGAAYNGFNGGTFSTQIKLSLDGTEITQGENVPADTWLTVTYDISYWLTADFSGAGYCNLSIVAPKNTIYVDNLQYHKASF